MENRDFFRMAVYFEGGMAVVAVVLGLLFGMKLWETASFDGATLFWSVAATIPMLFGFLVCKSVPLECFRTIDRLVADLFRDHLRPLPVWKLAVIGLLAGLGEELLFRGLIQTGLLHWSEHRGGSGLYGTASVVLFVSVLFGLGHAMTKTYFFLAMSISVYLGYVFLLTNNIVVPIVAHGLYDFIVFLRYKAEFERKTGRIEEVPEAAESIEDVE